MALITLVASLPVVILIGFNFLIWLGNSLRSKKPSSKETPNVSVLIASWNEGERVRDCLDSVLAQDYPSEKKEIIIMAGGDETSVNVCKEYEKKGLIRFFHEKKKQGKWKSLNFMVEKAKHDWIAFIDADCIAKKEWLTTLVSKKDEGDIIASNYIF